MAGGERKLVGRQNLGPAVHLQVARALSLAGFLDEAKDHNGCGFGRRTGGKGGEAHFAPEEQQGDSNRIPDPSVSELCGGNHPKAEPSWRAPPVDFPHDLIIAGLYEFPDHSSSRHG
jgi:hypothetical protein